MKKLRIPWLTQRELDLQLRGKVAYAYRCLQANTSTHRQMYGAVIMSNDDISLVARDYNLYGILHRRPDYSATTEEVAAEVLRLPVMGVILEELHWENLSLRFDPKTQAIVLAPT